MNDKINLIFQSAKGGYLDVCEWNDVACTDDRVTSIDNFLFWMTKKKFPFDFIGILWLLCETSNV